MLAANLVLGRINGTSKGKIAMEKVPSMCGKNGVMQQTRMISVIIGRNGRESLVMNLDKAYVWP